jgi:hypothetical protein
MTQPIQKNEVETIISDHSARSLALNYFSILNLSKARPFIKATTEDLEGMIEGYENVFKAEANIKIALNVVGF